MKNNIQHHDRLILAIGFGLALIAGAAQADSRAAPVTQAASRPVSPMAGPDPTIDAIPVCYNFGCKTRQTVSISKSEWATVANWFVPAAPTPLAERKQIRHAIGWLEVVIGHHTPIWRDIGRDLGPGAVFPGQMDCIDTSINTTTYLRLFEHYGLLKWHRVIKRAYRRAIINQHWAGQIEELATDKRYAVDAWFEPNGYLPYIQSSAEWNDIPFFSTSYNNTAVE